MTSPTQSAEIVDKPPVGSRIRRWLTRRPVGPAALFYLLLTFLIYQDVLFSTHRIASAYWSDIAMGEYSGRVWALPLLRHGHLPLWNPYSFSGMPFFTKSQVPSLYPGEWLGMFWSAGRSINQTLALHTFLAGLFVFLWARSRSLSFFGALTSGVLFMFSGAYFIHVYAGQVNDVTAMTWAPLLFMSVDLIIAGQTRRGVLIGVCAFAMQLYASQPQYTYFSVVALAIYLAIRLPKTSNPWKSLGICAGVCLWALAIGALELIPTLIQSGENLRGHVKDVTFFNHISSLPPEALLTTIMPRFFGDLLTAEYWGRWWVWSTNIFFGVVGMTLAVCGAVLSRRSEKRVCLAMSAALLILALGVYTPVYPAIFHLLPGISMFRGMCKFGGFLTLFVSLLAGMGIDVFVRSPKMARRPAAFAALFGVVLIAASWWVVSDARSGAAGIWGRFLHAISAPDENIQSQPLRTPYTILQTAHVSSAQMLAAGAMFLLTAGILLYVSHRRRRIPLLVCMVTAEMVWFAGSFRSSFDVRMLASPPLQASLAQAGDDRVLMRYNPNVTQLLGVSSVNGYDAFRLRRYAEFMAHTQGNSLNSALRLMAIYPNTRSPLLRLVRLRYDVTSADQPAERDPSAFPLSHVLLLDRARVMTGREKIFAALDSKDFNPEREVILEEQPNVQPVAGDGPAGVARVTGQDAEWLDIDADLTRPAVLLVTDAYSQYWEVTQHSGTSQNDYRVLPADYMLRAIPLTAGHHKLRLQYVAPAWKVSEAITAISLLAFIVYFAASVFQSRKRLPFQTPPRVLPGG